jgi:hypothetical protein
MSLRWIKRFCVAAASLAAATTSYATFHLFQISEIYSNADGTVQFIELHTAFGGQQFIGGHTITSTQGAITHSFTFPADLPADTTNKSFLVGTVGMAALGVVTPDYVVPDGFLFTTNGSVDYAGVDSVSYAALPTSGFQSIDHGGSVAVDSPTNFAGATGSIFAVPPTPAPPDSAIAVPTLGEWASIALAAMLAASGVGGSRLRKRWASRLRRAGKE